MMLRIEGMSRLSNFSLNKGILYRDSYVNLLVSLWARSQSRESAKKQQEAVDKLKRRSEHLEKSKLHIPRFRLTQKRIK